MERPSDTLMSSLERRDKENVNSMWRCVSYQIVGMSLRWPGQHAAQRQEGANGGGAKNITWRFPAPRRSLLSIAWQFWNLPTGSWLWFHKLPAFLRPLHYTATDTEVCSLSHTIRDLNHQGAVVLLLKIKCSFVHLDRLKKSGKVVSWSWLNINIFMRRRKNYQFG